MICEDEQRLSKFSTNKTTWKQPARRANTETVVFVLKCVLPWYLTTHLTTHFDLLQPAPRTPPHHLGSLMVRDRDGDLERVRRAQPQPQRVPDFQLHLRHKVRAEVHSSIFPWSVDSPVHLMLLELPCDLLWPTASRTAHQSVQRRQTGDVAGTNTPKNQKVESQHLCWYVMNFIDTKIEYLPYPRRSTSYLARYAPFKLFRRNILTFSPVDLTISNVLHKIHYSSLRGRRVQYLGTIKRLWGNANGSASFMKVAPKCRT